MLSLYLPILRADVTLLETHRWVEEAPLDCPLSVFGGVEDTSVPRRDLLGWARHSSQPGDLKMFPGGHFYPQTARQELLAEISRSLIGQA